MADEVIDILNREEYVDTVVRIIDAISKKELNRTFAIDGEWGVGKTWVLEQVENKLQNNKSTETNGDKKYLIVHYNCWQYDYYDEPLKAIVCVLLNAIDKTKLLGSNQKVAIKEVLKSIGKALWKQGSYYIKTKYGIDLSEIKNVIKQRNETSANIKQKMKEKFAFDDNYGFNAILQSLKKTLQIISKQFTIVFVVDELDRCLPEYAIKVLERLHHVFNKVSNTQVILAINKKQVSGIIQRIFNVEKMISPVEKKKILSDDIINSYLSKFFDFEIYLNEGNTDYKKFDSKFDEYSKLFEIQMSATKQDDINEFLNDLFTDFTVREKIRIVDKANLIHNIVATPDTKYDKTYMCIELTLVVCNILRIKRDTPPVYSQGGYSGVVNNIKHFDFLSNKISQTKSGYVYDTNENGVCYHNLNLIDVRSYVWMAFLIKNKVSFWNYNYIDLETREEYEDFIKSFAMYAKIIK